MTRELRTVDCRHFIGGSGIMGKDVHRLWREKRGEGAPVDLSADPIVQLSLVTVDLNCRWYELNSGQRVTDVQRHAVHKTIPWMAAKLNGLVKETGAVLEAKFILPWSFSGHGIRAKRSKSGAISFDLLEMEANHASVK
jgi:hypothetical protein